MIVGDAASFIEVYVQGAIMYGFRAAKAAAKEMKGGDGFAEYVDYWQTSYEYNRPHKMDDACRVALGLPALMDEELDYLFALMAPEKIRSYYDEFSLNRFIAAVMSHIPKMRGERADLAAKIETLFKAPLEEVLGGAGMKQYVE
jgi:flavin-dependent dehydrogenase